MEEKYENAIRMDLDKVGHKALEEPEIIKMLTQRIGSEILDENGNIDRKKLGTMVFGEDGKYNLVILEAVVWEYIDKEIDKVLEATSAPIILEAIKLPAIKAWKKCTTKILVSAECEERKVRVMERDSISEEEFDMRDNNSYDYSKCEFDIILNTSEGT